MTTVRIAVLILGFMTIGCASDIVADPVGTEEVLGSVIELGRGSVTSFARFAPDGTPRTIGVSFGRGSLEDLPEAHSDGHRCFDADGDGSMDPSAECSAWHERTLPLPGKVSRRGDIPFNWVLLNWNNHGHIPPGVWDVPHFDVHFYMEPIENIFALERGPCGPEFLRCDQFEIATRPMPSDYMHEDFINVDAAAPAMGNHLIDPTAPEFHGQPFMRSWIYGAYDGRLIFYEEMLALEYMRTFPTTCHPIKRVPAVAVEGFYPTRSCTRVHEETGTFEVSLDRFEYRDASRAAPADRRVDSD